MKVTLGILLLALLGLIALLWVSDAKAFELYTDQEQARYDEVLSSDTDTVYYYYQDSCHFCASIKDQISDFAQITNEKDDIDFKMVDLGVEENQVAWYDWQTHYEKYGEESTIEDNPDYISKPSEIKKIDDIKITGTPTMIYVQDGQVIEFGVGQDVFAVMEKAKADHNIDYQFDSSQYGA